MAVATPSDLAEALSAVSPAERRAVLQEAEQLRRDQCCGGSSLAEHIDPGAASQAAAIGKALADPVRAQLFDLLRRHGGEVCQCELSPLFELTQPTLSHHLRKLADARLVSVERRGRWAYYSINAEALDELRAWLS
ncbi:MAG TPA: metalloregulator ArsR/SmtB family transcription factor [Thermoleophilaceae bacterium]|jgi:ArsR family transcriptional regulator